jgi:hypothetical protein
LAVRTSKLDTIMANSFRKSLVKIVGETYA